MSIKTVVNACVFNIQHKEALKMKKRLLGMCAVVGMLVLAQPVAADTVGFWKFEEGSGQTTANEEVATRNLTLRRGTSSSAWADPEWTTNGMMGNAFHYINEQGGSEGNRDFLLSNTGVDVSPLVLGNFTVEAWIKLDSFPNGWNSNNPYYVIYLGDDDSSS